MTAVPPAGRSNEVVVDYLSHRLGAAPQTAAIPVVMVSGDSGGLAADELLAAGAADVLTKPVDIHELLATVGRYLT